MAFERRIEKNLPPLRNKSDRDKERRQSLIDQYFKASEEIYNRFTEDPRYKEIVRLLTPESNPELFDALSVIWQNWDVKDFQATDRWVRTPNFKVNIPRPPNGLLADIDYNSVIKPLRGLNIDRVIAKRLSEGGRISMAAKRLAYHSGKDYVSLGRNDEEGKRKLSPGCRKFWLDIVFIGNKLQIELFRGLWPITMPRIFHSQEDLLDFLAIQFAHKHGYYANEPMMAYTTYNHSKSLDPYGHAFKTWHTHKLAYRRKAGGEIILENVFYPDKFRELI